MAETGAGEGKARPEEVAAYIAAMTGEMGRLARNHNLHTLSYLLDLARMEALERAETGTSEDGQRIA